ncbi:alkaline phosphatase family protein [Metabacillus arenae]|uniref:Alkaline phosphatase family protein n=1 Tax=Metabacillus arenae TaxID=2771434 RepID=A0A926RXW5_9BACI|nr:alkaline phosphatase family protein [Metabacillus arenae]MBD1382323.1 alkaline phosphatase family protein [Metabacillus arenae]
MIFRSIIVVFLLFLLIGCSLFGPKHLHKPLNIIHTNDKASPKIVLVVVDSLMDKSFKKAIQEGKAPALEFFLKHGRYNKELVSSYPTMSVTIDSSLLTGSYPDKHKIPGLVWFKDNEQRVINYGNGFIEMIKYGVPPFAQNSLYQFNNVDLSRNAKTIHEDLDTIGKQTSSINVLVYRGNYKHILNTPNILAKTISIPDQYQTNGPRMLSLGAFIRQDQENKHLLNRVGINDAFSVQELKYLFKNNLLPDFTVMYMPENDYSVHRKGPMTTKGLEKLDKHLQEVLDVFPKWENALDNMIWIIIGDSSQSAVKKNKKEALIDLRKALSNYKVLKLGEHAQNSDEVAITANERMAYIYNLGDNFSIRDIAQKLQGDTRIAWLAWKENGMNRVISGQHKGGLHFKPKGPYKDLYNQTWDIRGNNEILDLEIKDNHHITYKSYPDGLARLHGALHSHKGNFLIVDAKPGYEFIGESSPEHTGGGAHGSMHKDDSLTSMIVTGTNKNINHLRMIDLKWWILDIIEKK